MVVVLCQFKNWYFSNFWWGNACIDGYVSKRKSDWISARIYYFPHHVTEYPDSTRVPENFWIFTRRILFGLDICSKNRLRIRSLDELKYGYTRVYPNNDGFVPYPQNFGRVIPV